MILFVDQSGQLGGAELCLADLAIHRKADSKVILFSDGPFAAHLRERGVDTEVLPLAGSASRITKKASPLTLVSAAPAMTSHILGLSRRIRGADVVYFNTAKALVYGTAANLLPSRPAVFHLHDLLDPRHFSRMNIRALVTAANRAKIVIANSTATAKAFKAEGGRTVTTVVPNGFDSAPFDTISDGTVANLRATLNPEGGTVAAIFGRLARWKGQDVLLRAAARLPDLAVWIVGDALFTADDHAFADELRAQAAALGSRVRFLGFRGDVPALMKAADIIVHCSTAPEPFGRVLVEGMLARRPVVAAQAGGPVEILAGNSAGRLVSPGDPSSLEEALRQLMESPSERARLGQAGRLRAETEYSLASVLARTDAILVDLA